MRKKNFDQCLSIDEYCTSGLLGMSLLKMQQFDFDGAVQLLEKLIAKNPTHDRGLCALGMVYERMSQKDRAIKFYETSIQKNIKNTIAMNSLLKLSYELKRFEEIKSSLSRYLEIYPENLKIKFDLALVLFKTDRWEEARSIIGQILISEPQNEDALKLLDQIETFIIPAKINT